MITKSDTNQFSLCELVFENWFRAMYEGEADLRENLTFCYIHI
jgi:hypothetical protein